MCRSTRGGSDLQATTYERDAIRPHVLGKFRDLLEATANSPAMMFYLDNWQSVTPPPVRPNAKGKQAVRGLNENYARELMELHTLGVDGGYTRQHDIIEVARCFTGWSINNPNGGGPFTYNDNTHDKGEKTVLGVTTSGGGGKEDGEKVLDILAAHASTAKFISKELAQRFVADDPPPVLIAAEWRRPSPRRVAKIAVLQTMIDSKQFFSQGAYRAKMKTPFEAIVSAVRATNAKVDSRDAAGESDRDFGAAALSQAGAYGIFERERRVGEFGVAAGADELRDATGAEQNRGRDGGFKETFPRFRQTTAKQIAVH